MATEEAIEFGRRLRAARQYGHADTPTREVTQAELAEALGYNREAVKAWEFAERYPKPGVRSGIAATILAMTGLPSEFFQVDFSELRRAMEADPALALGWTPDQEMQSGGERLPD